MAKGISLRAEKQLLLNKTLERISKLYHPGLYEFIEQKPVYNEELQKLEKKIHNIIESDYKGTGELKKELSEYYGVHQRASSAFRIKEK